MNDNFDVDRIVVGVDGSDSSIAALRYAGRLAEAFDAPLEAVITWTYPLTGGMPLIDGWYPDQIAADDLDEAIKRAFGQSPPDGLSRRVLSGPAARTLIEVSKSAGMLVLGSRGRGGFVGLLLGSVSAACAEHAHCPVLIVHPRADGAPSGEQSASESAATGRDTAQES